MKAMTQQVTHPGSDHQHVDRPEAVSHGLQREAARRLLEVDAMRAAFLAGISHELRTPLTTVLGFSITLRECGEGITAERRRDMLDRLTAAAERLDRLVGDLLDLKRLSSQESGPVREPVDLAALAIEVARLAGDGRTEVLADPGTWLVEPSSVRRSLEHLVANAVKFGTGRIVVCVESAREGVILSVEDEGPGVPDELKRAIFEPFRQGPGVPAHAPGTGVGLALVSHVAYVHDGRAWVEDRRGGGSVFRLLLTAARVAPMRGCVPQQAALPHDAQRAMRSWSPANRSSSTAPASPTRERASANSSKG